MAAMPSPAEHPPFCWPHAAAPAAPRRRVLLLSYYSLPHIRVGTHRVEALSRWLHAFGWEPTIITAARDGAPENYIQTPDHSWMGRVESGQQAGVIRSVARGRSRLVQSLKSLLRRLPPWHDEYSAWSRAVTPTAIAVGREHAVDLVWVTCNPFSSVETALATGQALGVPVVVDLRDQFPDYLLPGQWFFRAMRRVNAVTLATTSCATPALWQTWGHKPMSPILSGMWETEHVPAQPTPHFTVLHAGNLYGGQRDPGPLLQAMAILARELPEFARDARLRLVGADSADVADHPDYAPVAELCELIGQTPYSEVRAMMAAASTLLILMGDDAYLCDAVPAKLYDYLPYSAPVLAIGGKRGILADVLRWSGCGGWETRPEGIAEFLRARYLQWKIAGIVDVPRNPDALEYLTQRRMAAEFAEVFNATVEGRPVSCRETLPWEAGS